MSGLSSFTSYSSIQRARPNGHVQEEANEVLQYKQQLAAKEQEIQQLQQQVQALQVQRQYFNATTSSTQAESVMNTILSITANHSFSVTNESIQKDCELALQARDLEQDSGIATSRLLPFLRFK
jgi:hypothetical protein